LCLLLVFLAGGEVISGGERGNGGVGIGGDTFFLVEAVTSKASS
jgi:uncharacterized protein GlcG (DUF336 family)